VSFDKTNSQTFIFDGPFFQHALKVNNRGYTLIDGYAPGDRLTGSKTFDFASIAAGSFEVTTVTVTGARVGDTARAALSAGAIGLNVFAQVTADNTVSVWAYNFTGSAVDPVSGTLTAEVSKIVRLAL
jgi:hypothetical protein